MPEKRPLPSEGSTALVEATKRQKLNEMVLATQKGNQVVQAVRYLHFLIMGRISFVNEELTDFYYKIYLYYR